MIAARRLALRLLATCALAAHVACAAASPTAHGRALLTSTPTPSARRARALTSLATLDPSDAYAVRDALEAAPATRRGLVEVAVNALFDVFGFEAGGASSAGAADAPSRRRASARLGRFRNVAPSGKNDGFFWFFGVFSPLPPRPRSLAADAARRRRRRRAQAR